MFTNVTPAVERAIKDAQTLSMRAGHAEIRPDHLLLALLDQEGGSVEALLLQVGFDISKKGEFLGALITEDVSVAIEQQGEAHYSPEMEKIWHRARELAVESADGRVVASQHLLLALLEHEPVLRERLENSGLNANRLDQLLLAPKPLPLDEPLTLAGPTEEIHLARIIDASANRAREALRVLEDYCRFAVGDEFLSGQLKQIRHDLAAALGFLPIQHLLESRETERDVGRTLTTPGEETRYSMDAVLQANCKRLQEALRTLEEYGKIHSPDFGRQLEKLRYQSYTLERALMLRSYSSERLADVRVCVLVTETECAGPLEWTVNEAIAGGARMIQLREKNFSDRQLLECARKIRRLTREAGVLFIVNDRPDIARLAEADGVHLGQDDMRVMEARQILGPTRLIGVSTHDLDQVRRAVLDGACYMGVGPTFPSATKEFAKFPGLEFVKEASRLTSIPAFVIGGVTVENIDQVVAARGSRVAVSQAICSSSEPRQVVAELLRALNERKG